MFLGRLPRHLYPLPRVAQKALHAAMYTEKFQYNLSEISIYMEMPLVVKSNSNLIIFTDNHYNSTLIKCQIEGIYFSNMEFEMNLKLNPMFNAIGCI